MHKLLTILLLGISLPTLSESLECQIMREQILKEARGFSECDKYLNSQNKGDINSPDTSGFHYAACKQGEIIGRGLAAGVNALNGQPATLQDRINLYKQKCE
jgi:hypothetical protein